MRIIIYTIDFFEGREALMPWRLVLEVAQGIKAFGHEIMVLNGCHNNVDIRNTLWRGIPIIGLTAGWEALIKQVRITEADVVFLPITWRAGLKRFDTFRELKCIKIAYISSGVYSISGCFALMRYASARIAVPYFGECLVPKRILGWKMHRQCFKATITLTEFSRLVANKSGLPNPFCIYPGKDTFANLMPDADVLNKYGLSGRKWFLYTGSSAAIRGAGLLVKAIDRAKKDIKLVMLIRWDKGSTMDELNLQLDSMKHRERIVVITDRMNREQLISFFSSAWYGVLPFLVIPSEVPLTYFEMLCCGTPIISFPNGGTTDYLKPALAIAERSISGLTDTLETVWSDEQTRHMKHNAGLELMANHPIWSTVASYWERVLASINTYE